MSKKQNFHANPALLSNSPVGGPDAEVILLCDIIVAGHREMSAMWDRHADLTGDMPRKDERRVRALVNEGHELSERVAEMRTTTLAGYRAKAAALLTYVQRHIGGGPVWSNHDELLGWSLARDLLSLGDGAPLHECCTRCAEPASAS